MRTRLRRNPEIPEEIIYEILAYLQVKPLCRFRCVSKRWCSLISHPDFVKMHTNKAIENEDILYQRRRLIFTDGINKSLYSLALDEFLNRIYAVDAGVVSKLDFKLRDDGDNGVLLVAYCNGLALFKLYSGENIEELYIANPATREYKQLPMAPYPDHFLPLGFGFDTSIEDYKLVTMCALEEGFEFSVYTLKTGSWRVIERLYPYKLRRCFDGVLLNGGLHWFVRSEVDDEVHEEEDDDEEEEGDPCVIICFNLEAEDVKEISLPFDESFEADKYNVALYQGQLCVTHNDFGEQHNEFWVMKEYGVEESWTKIIISPVLPYWNYTPTCYRTKDHDLWVGDGQLVMCNFDDDDSSWNLPYVRKLPHVSGQVGIYIESLFSLE